MSPDSGIKLVFILGIINWLALTALLLSCRCLGQRWLAGALKWPPVARFYQFHCYFWFFLWLSVGSHVLLGLFLLGTPFSN